MFLQCLSHDADTCIFKYWADKGCVDYRLNVGWAFIYISPNDTYPPSVCCAFLVTEMHCAVQFNVFDICMLS